MSANNYILVKEVKPDKFEITHREYDVDYIMGKKIEVEGLREAMTKAEEYRENIGIIEYGIEYSLLGRKENVREIKGKENK